MFDFKKIKKERTFEIINQSVSKEEIRQLSQIKNIVGFVVRNSPLSDDDVKELCELSNLVNVTFDNTDITDQSLEYLSQLPELSYLWITKANITGKGFSYFKTHKKIKSISACSTKVNDDTLKYLAEIPNLNTLRIDDTKVTFEGLQAISTNPFLNILSKDFSKKQIDKFRSNQRLLLKKGTINKDDRFAAEIILQSFFKAMTIWEKSTKGDFSEKAEQDSLMLFKEYCTEKNHKIRGTISGGPNFSYATHQIIDADQVSKNKLYLFTEDSLDFQYRFTIVRNNKKWKIDGVYNKFGKWTIGYL